jgi:hypothetical protein
LAGNINRWKNITADGLFRKNGTTTIWIWKHWNNLMVNNSSKRNSNWEIDDWMVRTEVKISMKNSYFAPYRSPRLGNPRVFYTFYLVYIWHCRIKLFLRHLPNCPCSNFSRYVDLFQEISPRIAKLSLILYQSKNCGHRIDVLFMMYDVYWYCQMKKNEWLWKFWKRNDLYSFSIHSLGNRYRIFEIISKHLLILLQMSSMWSDHVILSLKISDVKHNILSSITLFADDTAFIKEINNHVNDFGELNNDLGTLNSFYDIEPV